MFILKAIAIGSVTGLLASIPLGPAGMESVKRSIDKGFFVGFLVSVGAILADYIYIFLIHFGLGSILSLNKGIEGLFWIISGIILFIFNKLSRIKIKDNNKNKFDIDKVPGVLNGFLITFLNPTTPSIWIALSGTVMKDWSSHGANYYYIAISSMLIVTIIWFIILNLLASSGLKKFAGEKASGNASNIIYYILYLLSIGFILFGLFKFIM